MSACVGVVPRGQSSLNEVWERDKYQTLQRDEKKVEMDETSEDLVFCYPDWQASTFAVDYSGRRAVLAVQKWLAVVSLENVESSKAIRKLARQNKYEIKVVLWNPHSSQRDLIASTSQQKLEVWNVNAERHPLLYSIKAHTRPVSDLSWSFTDPNLLASCAVDSFVHVWDVRDNRRPKTSFRVVAGASLVQWNKINGNILASAHDSDIRVWDLRKPTTASGYITAHTSRIHDLDWSYTVEKELTTCSHDASIKFWDTSSTREPLSVIKVGTQPLWRARNYPAGKGVAMAVVPAMHGGDSRVFLWSRTNVSVPLHQFTGHTDPVLEVQWRKYKGDYQLVTWSKDRSLRVWGIGEDLRQDLGGGPVDQTLNEEELSLEASQMSITMGDGEAEQLANKSDDYSQTTHQNHSTPLTSSTHERLSPRQPVAGSSSPAVSMKTFQPQHTSLAQEFSLLNLDNIPSLEMEKMDASQRTCTVKVTQGNHLVRIDITFPSHYPTGAAPSFNFDSWTTTIDTSSRQELLGAINKTAENLVKEGRPCLEACLRRLQKALEQTVSRPQPPTKLPDFDIGLGYLEDVHIPFPRTSGGRFCANGVLVCFSLPPSLSLPADVTTTPRSMDKLIGYRSNIRPLARPRWSGYLSSSLPKRGSATNLLLQVPGGGHSGRGDKHMMSLSGESPSNPYVGRVTIHNITHMLPIDYNLAMAYSLVSPDMVELCSHNASVAASHGRMDLVQAWSTVALIANMDMKVSPDPYEGVPWSQHPFGRELIHSLFNHFAQLHDIQTLAMLACIFQLHVPLYTKDPASTNTNNTHTVVGTSRTTTTTMTTTTTALTTSAAASAAAAVAAIVFNTSSPPKRASWQLPGAGNDKTSSWQEGDQEGEDLVQEQQAHEMNCKLLDDLLTRKCDEFRRSYTNILYSWGMLNQRAEVLKFQVTQPDTPLEIGFASMCRQCNEIVKGPSCSKCRCFTFTCSLCNLAVRGSSNFCQSCGHGGHARHMIDWFSKNTECPAGCGCKCLDSSGWT